MRKSLLCVFLSVSLMLPAAVPAAESLPDSAGRAYIAAGVEDVPDYAEGWSLEEREFTAYLADETSQFDMSLYFSGEAPDLPFVELGEWSGIMTDVFRADGDETYDLSMEADGPVVEYRRDNGYSMLFDFDEGTVAFDDYDAFLHYSNDDSLLDQASFSLYSEDGTEYLVRKINKGSYDRYGSEVTLDLGAYHIPMLTDGRGGYYLPLQTMSDLLLSRSLLLLALYNGNSVIFANPEDLGDQSTGELTELGDLYYSGDPGAKSEGLAWFGYCELCMALDCLYGQKGTHDIDSFDAFFTETGYRTLLSDTDPTVSDLAMNEIITFYMDDLHSYYTGASYKSDGEETLLDVLGISDTRYEENYSRLEALRAEYPDAGKPYMEIGNTAYITFDSFEKNYSDDEYYTYSEADTEERTHEEPSSDPLFDDIPAEPGAAAGLGRTEMTGSPLDSSAEDGEEEGGDWWQQLFDYEDPEAVPDTIDLICYAHSQITREDSPIENVVLDLTCNSGGMVDAAVFVIGWFLGEASISAKDILTGAMSTSMYLADANLDYQYDERDTVSDRRLFCLISPNSFSCGNLTAAACKSSNRVTLLGQTTAGGSSIVQPLSTAWGTLFRISSPINLSTLKNGAYYDIDQGIEPDIYISDPANFYDREALTDYINALF